MLKKKMIRDILQNKSQFLTIFLMIVIGVMVYAGINSYMDGMTNAANKYYLENNLQDLNVIGNTFTSNDLDNIKNIKHVNNAELKLTLTGLDANNGDITYLLNFIDSNEISRFYIYDGEEFNKDKNGAWIDKFYANSNNIKVGDIIKLKYDTFTLEEKVLGIVTIPDHVYDIKDESEIMTDRSKYGIVYLSSNQIPENYIKSIVMKKLNIENEIIFDLYLKDFDYKKYIPYNYIMVDVDEKSNVESVKNDIEDNIKNALAVLKIEDSLSYTMYQSEIDEGASYIGIFSGLFLAIALLSVITTMTRVIKKQKIQIGTLKALGFKKSKVLIHYIGYGFFISILASVFGILLGRFFIGNVFINLEMSFFEMPNGIPIIKINNYIMAICVIFAVSFVTYLTCRSELVKIPAESLRNEIPKVKKNSLNLTTKGFIKNLGFSSKWNLRDIIRNKFRTITAIFGIVGCCTLIVCAFGMLNSMNNFIKIQFDDLYNFNYKLNLKSDIEQAKLDELFETYGNATSQTLQVEIKTRDNKRTSNTIFVTDAKDLVRFNDENENFMDITSTDGVYITKKLAETEGYNLGDEISWHIYGDKNYYTSKIIGFNKDPQNQCLTSTREYIENLKIDYIPDSLYTNYNLDGVNEIDGVETIQDINALKEGMTSMLSMMKTMITLIIFFAMLLGAVIIYNMGILSYSEKQYQFSTLKVLGFANKKIKQIFIEQNIFITIASIIIGLPSGYYLTSWLFKACLDESYDFSVHINISTYIIATLGTFLVSFVMSKFLSRKINKIDMVSSLKGNE